MAVHLDRVRVALVDREVDPVEPLGPAALRDKIERRARQTLAAVRLRDVQLAEEHLPLFVRHKPDKAGGLPAALHQVVDVALRVELAADRRDRLELLDHVARGRRAGDPVVRFMPDRLRDARDRLDLRRGFHPLKHHFHFLHTSLCAGRQPSL